MERSPNQAIDIIVDIYRELNGGQFNLEKILKSLIDDFGVDGEELTAVELKNALQGSMNAKWFDINFACESALATYSVSECSNDEFIRSIAAMCLLANCIQRNVGELEFFLDYVLTILLENRTKSSFSVRERVMRLLLCNRHKQEEK
ncbi:hypothetical protein AB1L42_23010 [Thalassoglobus sp. JC818]|uniref:hypothetical protein n=1 Tax=Thalassoglobus sp. JC818 TaxID=3232136 RepID=UPI003457BD8C